MVDLSDISVALLSGAVSGGAIGGGVSVWVSRNSLKWERERFSRESARDHARWLLERRYEAFGEFMSAASDFFIPAAALNSGHATDKTIVDKPREALTRASSRVTTIVDKDLATQVMDYYTLALDLTSENRQTRKKAFTESGVLLTKIRNEFRDILNKSQVDENSP
jgi:hypothetical protein